MARSHPLEELHAQDFELFGYYVLKRCCTLGAPWESSTVNMSPPLVLLKRINKDRTEFL